MAIEEQDYEHPGQPTRHSQSQQRRPLKSHQPSGGQAEAGIESREH
jgi:hypothetical protein